MPKSEVKVQITLEQTFYLPDSWSREDLNTLVRLQFSDIMKKWEVVDFVTKTYPKIK
jgi:hypothetical protein